MRHGLQRIPTFLLLLLSLPLTAQSVRDSVTIEVVDVPVFVTRADQPVEGLTRNDFELIVNGRPQAIDYFDAIDPADSPEPSLRERRLFLLVFDLAFSTTHSLGRAQQAASELIEKAPPGDLFAIATFSSRRSIWFATPFTADRIALARGIGSLMSSKSGDPLSIVLTESERVSTEQWAMGRHLGESPDGDRILNRIAGEAMRDIVRMQFARTAEHQIESFQDLAERLAALQGQKHVVLLSDGYGTREEQVVSYSWSHPYRFIREMEEAFQSADAMLHTLDLKGVHMLAGNDSLRVLSHSTGGRSVRNRNDLGAGLVDLADTYRRGYVLGFRPASAKPKHNSIEVRVKNLPRGATVSHREGFSGTPRDVSLDDGLYLADVVLNDVPQTGTAAALELEGETLTVRVPLRPLAAQLGRTGTADLLLYVFGENGVALGFHRKTIDVTTDATGERVFEVEMPEGARVAKALLRVEDSLGFSRTGA